MSPHQPVATTAARMALLNQKPLNVNGAYQQKTAYLVLLTRHAGAGAQDDPESSDEAAA